MNSVNKTLYIPLYGKAYVSRKGILLRDPKAEAIWAAEGFPLKGKSRSKWLAYYMGMRSAVFDRWLERQLDDPLSLTEDTGLSFLREWEMTTDTLIRQLDGLERAVFKKIFTGKLAKKIYRLYEYQ